MTETRFYHVSFDKELKRQVQQLPGKLRQEAKQRIADLAVDPRPLGAIELRDYAELVRDGVKKRCFLAQN